MSGRPGLRRLSALRGGTGARRVARRSADALVERYRSALAAGSRTLPVYLRTADVAGMTLRALRPGESIAPLPDPDVPAVGATAVSAAGELSFVLTGATAWRRTIRGVEFRRADERHRARPLIAPAGDVVRVLAPLPDTDPGWTVVLLDAENEPLDLPVPDLSGRGEGDS